MVVSDRYKFIYSVIPKCASASIRHALRSYVDRGWPLDNTIEQHITLAHVHEDAELKLFYDHGYFSFTFVRNPYDRLYSSFRQDYYASQHYPKWIDVKTPIFEKIGFDFKRYVLEHVANANLKKDWDWITFCPMIDFYSYNGMTLDFVGKFENLGVDIDRLSEKLGIKVTVEESHNIREERDRSYMDYYDQELLAFVNATYREDFEIFGYEQIGL